MNKQGGVLTDIVVYSFLVAGIFVMTEPNSQGPKFITALTTGYANVVQAASGQKLSHA